ncbi:MAG: DUF3102 domain-containing protein [Oscillospiraceae bacterium]|jgi:hypothetical protein|nr:DUF3102 domain-containing protein [Oscillospiraceae bacterium]
MKQTYICKCGKTFEKYTTADTTGYRLGGDFGAKHECFGCPFVVPITEGYPNPKVVDYECRASRKINYRTTADIARSRDGFHVGRVFTLDLNFAREIWTFSRKLPGLDDPAKEMDQRGPYGADGRYCLTLYFSKIKAGVASSGAVSDRFFDGKTERPGMTEEQEKQRVLAMIKRKKQAAKENGLSGSQKAETVTGSPRSMEQITMEINFYKAQTAQNIIEIGKRLIEAKQQLPHGEWLPWLKDKVQFSNNSAERFMRIAQEFSNSSPVTNLPYTKLLALLQVPEEDREKFIKETHLVNGREKAVPDMSKRELEQAIKERDEARRFKEQLQERCEKAEKAVQTEKEKANESLQIAQSQKQLDLRKITELEDTIKELESRPVDVAVQQPSEADKQNLRQEGADFVRERYEKQLKAARQDLEEAKRQARQTVGLDQDEIVCAAASFRDSLDSIWDNFKMILRLSSGKTAESVSDECIKHMQGILSEIINCVAEAKNISLLDEEVELPPADGLER